MSSLSYSDEHLAWQQRVQKEVTMASSFIKYPPHSTLERTGKPYRVLSSYAINPIPEQESPRIFKKIPRIHNSLMETNVHAEVRGKYARAPILNLRPFTTKNNAFNSFIKKSSQESTRPSKHLSILDKRRLLLRRKISQSPKRNEEFLESDIEEMARLLKIEKLKRLIMQRRLESRE